MSKCIGLLCFLSFVSSSLLATPSLENEQEDFQLPSSLTPYLEYTAGIALMATALTFASGGFGSQEQLEAWYQDAIMQLARNMWEEELSRR